MVENSQTYTFDQMDQQLYLSYFSACHFVFSYKNHCDASKGRPNSSFLQILEGSVQFEIDGGWIHGNAGDFFYIPEGVRYLSYWTGMPRIAFYTTYHRFLPGYASSLDRPDSNYISLDRQFAFQKVDSLCGFSAADEMGAICREYSSNCQDQLMAISRLYRLMFHIYPYLKKQITSPINPAILQAVVYIEQNFKQNDPIRFYAELCHLSESRFYYLFRDSMNCSPVEFRNHLRVRHAALLLIQSDYTIEQVAELTGFESAEYFRRVFKKNNNLTPSEYRQGTK